MKEIIRQVEIVHFSDIHFGSGHRFVPPPTPDGDRGAPIGYPNLAQKLQEDFIGADPGCPVIVCITGDITTKASYDEFVEAEEFINSLMGSTIYGRTQSINSIFVVPGNHDVNYLGKTIGERWQPWTEFYNRLYNTNHKREDPWATAKVHDLIDDMGIVVLCLNSSIYVEKGTASERRGELDIKQLDRIKKELEAIPTLKLESAIRIALIHHHPVLIPVLVEGDRGYDAVFRSDKLLSILHQFGFHLFLHGHKHYPVSFLERVNSAFVDIDDQPIMIVAGGSVGSLGLPEHPKKTNCYNRITVKWHPKAGQARIRVATRGLEFYDKDVERLPTEWQWKQLKEEDRSFYSGKPIPTPNLKALRYIPNSSSETKQKEDVRIIEYTRRRGNMPIVEVMPSLKADQAYEARFWIVGHRRKPQDIPDEVTWSAGEKFPTLIINKNDDKNFCGIFNYWGPMLIQAHMKFADGECVDAYIYARMPENYKIYTP
jgi:3',5'-cyclic AMP phosphodiesterase CpdA